MSGDEKLEAVDVLSIVFDLGASLAQSLRRGLSKSEAAKRAVAVIPLISTIDHDVDRAAHGPVKP
jgi:hypothetical protein